MKRYRIIDGDNIAPLQATCVIPLEQLGTIGIDDALEIAKKHVANMLVDTLLPFISFETEENDLFSNTITLRGSVKVYSGMEIPIGEFEDRVRVNGSSMFFEITEDMDMEAIDDKKTL